MSIVKRKDSAGRNYYINTNTGKRTTEASYNRSKGAAKSAKTQFKTATGYKCSTAGSILGKQKGKAITPKSRKAGATLASKMCDNPKKKR
jgi:hypothetical protein